MQRTYRAATGLMAVCLVVWIVLSWPAIQDDALIHLRYADHLLHQHIVSYDGVHVSFGASSLLYITILAILRSVTTSPLLPRAVSSVGHLILFAGLALFFVRALRSAPRMAWLFALVLLGALATPSSVRWLDDGMETSLVLIFISIFAIAVSHFGRSRDLSLRASGCFVVLGFITVMLRIELLMLLGFGSLMLFAARRLLPNAPSGLAGQIKIAVRCAAPLAGGLLAALFIIATMHSLLPDTALAKALGFSQWPDTLRASEQMFASSFSFGLVSLALWILSFAALIVYRRGVSLAALLANCLFPLTLFLACIRGQAVQGIRYYEWTLFFPILWNLLELPVPKIAPRRALEDTLRYTGYALIAVLLLSLPVESVLFYRVFRGRTACLNAFRDHHFERLQSLPVVAFDIGYIGYFTGSDLCDPAGLVNGRAAAALNYSQRLARCAAQKPQYAFFDQATMDDFSFRLDLRDWSLCGEYPFTNLTTPNMHYLIASPEAANAVCSAAGNAPKPLGSLLPPIAH